jgi:hypothetical protein
VEDDGREDQKWEGGCALDTDLIYPLLATVCFSRHVFFLLVSQYHDSELFMRAFSWGSCHVLPKVVEESVLENVDKISKLLVYCNDCL